LLNLSIAGKSNLPLLDVEMQRAASSEQRGLYGDVPVFFCAFNFPVVCFE